MVKPDKRLVFSVSSMVGHFVQVQTMNGAVYEGVLHAFDVESKGSSSLGVALRKAYKKPGATASEPFKGPPEPPSREGIIQRLVIKGSDLAQISAAGVDLAYKAPPPDDSFDTFTDTGISGGHAGGRPRERELQAWQPEDGDDGELLTMDNVQAKNGTFWSAEDMFKRAEKDHNYKSGWNEEEYTTKLDRNDPEFHRKMREAERLAREIVSGDGVARSDNVHVLSDRGVEISENEEALYGSVHRGKNQENNSNSNSHTYQPPHRRTAGPPPGMDKQQAKHANRPDSASSSIDGGERQLGANSIGEPTATKEELQQFQKQFKIDKKKEESKANDNKDKDQGKESKGKLNPNAKEFTFNLAAPSFVPQKAPADTPTTPVSGGVHPQTFQQQQQQFPAQQSPATGGMPGGGGPLSGMMHGPPAGPGQPQQFMGPPGGGIVYVPQGAHYPAHPGAPPLFMAHPNQPSQQQQQQHPQGGFAPPVYMMSPQQAQQMPPPPQQQQMMMMASPQQQPHMQQQQQQFGIMQHHSQQQHGMLPQQQFMVQPQQSPRMMQQQPPPQ